VTLNEPLFVYLFLENIQIQISHKNYRGNNDPLETIRIYLMSAM
jgi:hypothetical protein